MKYISHLLNLFAKALLPEVEWRLAKLFTVPEKILHLHCHCSCRVLSFSTMASLCYFRVAFIFQTDIIFIVKSDYLRRCLGDEWWYVNLLISFCGVAMGNGYLSVKRTSVTMANTQYRFKVYNLLRLTVHSVWNFLGILSVIFLEWMKFICAIYCNISTRICFFLC